MAAPASPVFDGDVVPRIVAVIPARGGSVSVPRKNIKILQGRPLIDWVIQAAEYSGIFDEARRAAGTDIITAAATAAAAVSAAPVGPSRRRRPRNPRCPHRPRHRPLSPPPLAG